jgi:hypothetical protein
LTVEAPLEPDLPLCGPHHHLWDGQTARLTPRYLLDEILEDVQSGHNVVSTVFIECGAMFKAAGPEALRPRRRDRVRQRHCGRAASGLGFPSPSPSPPRGEGISGPWPGTTVPVL